MPAPPRYATPRTPARPTFGPAVARVAEALGKPLQVWQRQVVDVALELVPDATGPIVHAGARWSWAYRTVVVHVQRQAGKTTLIGPVSLHRCLTRQRAKTWLTAQTRQDGRDVWRDVADLVDASPLSSMLTKRRSNGSEELACAATGSALRVFAPNEDALHGKANELVTVDESWAFTSDEGAALQQAILPTFTTTGGQLWLPSTAGTAASGWLRGYVERGRAAVAAGQTTGIAYFEWSLSPAEVEQVAPVVVDLARAGGVVTDELRPRVDHALDLVLSRHPGEFVRRDAVLDAMCSMAPGEFLRAYGNHWTLTADSAIPDHLWAACRRQLQPPEPGQPALAYDVALDQSTAAVGAAWTVEGAPAVDSIDERPGADWLVERIEQLAARWGVTEVWHDAAGPALDVADKLRRRGKVTPVGITFTDWKAACSGLLADVTAAQLRHRGTSALDDAAAAVTTRDVGDGWVWSRRGSAGSIASICAVTAARWGLDHAAPPAPKPVVAGGRRRVDDDAGDGTGERRRGRILTT